ncbi:ParB N-terminal domain-containing protein [Stygiolobus sp. RP850M]|uniref:ParB N-terminal domain-containing protein n=1 Tax=Stygiolobus sp. RP850M TaxID=3133137 RepID=UPI00307D2700
MSFTLGWLNPLDLKPHEDVIESIVVENINMLKRFCKIVPIVVDRSSLTILDGHHRHQAAVILGLDKIPVVLVDYRSEDIKIENWYLRIENKNTFNLFVNSYLLVSYDQRKRYCATIKGIRIICDESIFRLYWKTEHLKQKFEKLGLKAVKVTEPDGIALPPIDKETVIKLASMGLRFPPKSTRHVYKFFIPREELSLKC